DGGDHEERQRPPSALAQPARQATQHTVRLVVPAVAAGRPASTVPGPRGPRTRPAPSRRLLVRVLRQAPGPGGAGHRPPPRWREVLVLLVRLEPVRIGAGRSIGAGVRHRAAAGRWRFFGTRAARVSIGTGDW